MDSIRKAFLSKQDAIQALLNHGYAWEPIQQCYVRGTPYISLVRAYVGQCKSGQWLVTKA